MDSVNVASELNGIKTGGIDMTNYRLKVKYRNRWIWGLNTYPTIEAAQARKAEMEAAGHKVKIELESKLFN